LFFLLGKKKKCEIFQDYFLSRNSGHSINNNLLVSIGYPLIKSSDRNSQDHPSTSGTDAQNSTISSNDIEYLNEQISKLKKENRTLSDDLKKLNIRMNRIEEMAKCAQIELKIEIIDVSFKFIF
jgi:predicted RNase H-like nuclease (RuvC/YqgF family)